jgi:hypothetical protein
MEANLQRRVRRYGWDKARPITNFGTSSSRPRKRGSEPAALKPGERIDVACSTGLVTFPAAAAVPGW